MYRKLALASLVLWLFAFPPAMSAQQQVLHAGEYAQADIQYGATVYASHCTSCHGANGDQISAVNFKSGRFRNASSDEELRRIIANGIPGTAMPAQNLDTAQMTGIVAFLRNMRDFNTQAITLGDAARGRSLFEGRCLTCHAVDGKGSHVAPDLSDIGSSRAVGALQQSLLDPSSAMFPINRPVRIVTKDGKVINGRRLNEDTYTIQIMDDHERLLSLSKGDLREFTVLTTSPMPSYKGVLNAQELSDVLAYLVSLKGK